MPNLEIALQQLREERKQAQLEVETLDQAISVLSTLHGGSSSAKPGRTISVVGRKRISLAQKARWAKAKGHAPKPKRTISAAGKKRIAAAARARWAKFRAAK
jgi:negative regulator of replication initiation